MFISLPPTRQRCSGTLEQNSEFHGGYTSRKEGKLGVSDTNGPVFYTHIPVNAILKQSSSREKAILNKTDTADKRKQAWDAKAKNREFAVGEEVLARKPGMNLKLADSWEGPFIVYQKEQPSILCN